MFYVNVQEVPAVAHYGYIPKQNAFLFRFGAIIVRNISVSGVPTSLKKILIANRSVNAETIIFILTLRNSLQRH
jgi:hypothetical protein